MTDRSTMHLGMDIGGTKCTVSLGCYDASALTVLDKRRFSTCQTPTPRQTIERLNILAHDLLAAHQLQHHDIASIGISCGGPLDSQRGMILSPPNLRGWDAVPLVAEIEKHTGISAFLENDANACALAEWRWGAGQRCDNMIFLTFGTGLGAGLILNGQLYHGTNNLAGEVGHIRLAQTGPMGYGKAGSFEGFCSGAGLADAASRLGLTHTADEIFQRAASGDDTCIGLIEQMGWQLGNGLAILIDILNPQKIIMGSIFTRQEQLLRPLLESQIRKQALDPSLRVCEILPTQLGESLGDFAALAVARHGDWT